MQGQSIGYRVTGPESNVDWNSFRGFAQVLQYTIRCRSMVHGSEAVAIARSDLGMKLHFIADSLVPASPNVRLGLE